jgi:hypothetical protein
MKTIGNFAEDRFNEAKGTFNDIADFGDKWWTWVGPQAVLFTPAHIASVGRDTVRGIASGDPLTIASLVPAGRAGTTGLRVFSRIARTVERLAGGGAGKGETTLYRAVSDAELDDIAKNGFRVDPTGRGYQLEKLFTGTAKDAARQAQIVHKLSGQVSTIIEARFPAGVDILSIPGDSMDIFSVPAQSLSRGRLSGVFRNASPRP